MLPTEITDLIKKKAEEKYESGGFESFDDCIISREAYFSGQTEGIELMIGFTEWVSEYYYKVHGGYIIRYQNQIAQQILSTTDLLTKYIKEVL